MLVATTLVGCQLGASSASPSISTEKGNSSSSVADAGINSSTDGGVVSVAGEGGIQSITTSPLPLAPAFSPSTYDYYVRCASGGNTLQVNVASGGATQTQEVTVAENQSIEIAAQYYIRCLPSDFPVLTATQGAGGPTPGYYLINGTTYAMVLDTNGTPVWYTHGTSVMNVDALLPDTISFLPNGVTGSPFGTSLATIFQVRTLDSQVTTSVSAVGTPTDGHEFRLLPNGDHLIFTYPILGGFDLTGLQSFGPNETIADCEVQEIDPSGDLVWSWLATDHVDPVEESIEPASDTINGETVIDVFHFNSIDVDASGNMLLSSRHANALFYVNRATGQVVWKLGGTPYNKDGASYITVVGDSETAFNMQHDARFLPNGDVSVFDDHGATAGEGVARGVEYAINFDAGTATPVFQYLGTAQSQYEGSFRRYSDGHSVIGWGYIPTDPRAITEIDSNGNDVFDVTLDSGNLTYRAVKLPLTQLSIGVLRSTSGT